MVDMRHKLPTAPTPFKRRSSPKVRRLVLELLSDLSVNQERIADADLAAIAGLSPVSVNYAINDLADAGYIEAQGKTSAREITMTELGEQVAEGHEELR